MTEKTSGELFTNCRFCGCIPTYEEGVIGSNPLRDRVSIIKCTCGISLEEILTFKNKKEKEQIKSRLLKRWNSEHEKK